MQWEKSGRGVRCDHIFYMYISFLTTSKVYLGVNMVTEKRESSIIFLTCQRLKTVSVHFIFCRSDVIGAALLASVKLTKTKKFATNG